MPVYDLYNTASGALLRSEIHAEQPATPTGKPWAWQAQDKPAETHRQLAQWDATEREWALSDRPLAEHKARKIKAVKNIGPIRVAEGFKYTVPGGSQHTYQVDLESQSHMLAIFVELLDPDGPENPHGGFWRDAANANVTMSDAEVKDFLHAAKAYKMAIIRRGQALVDAIVAAADHDALDLINTTTGAIDGEGSWPTNNG